MSKVVRTRRHREHYDGRNATFKKYNNNNNNNTINT
jgi:hypothetical protein